MVSALWPRRRQRSQRRCSRSSIPQNGSATSSRVPAGCARRADTNCQRESSSVSAGSSGRARSSTEHRIARKMTSRGWQHRRRQSAEPRGEPCGYAARPRAGAARSVRIMLDRGQRPALAQATLHPRPAVLRGCSREPSGLDVAALNASWTSSRPSSCGCNRCLFDPSATRLFRKCGFERFACHLFDRRACRRLHVGCAALQRPRTDFQQVGARRQYAARSARRHRC